jgi:hypothetical protein
MGSRHKQKNKCRDFLCIVFGCLSICNPSSFYWWECGCATEKELPCAEDFSRRNLGDASGAIQMDAMPEAKDMKKSI